MADTLNIAKQKLLVVEGEDERGFFTALSAGIGITDVQVLSIGGKTKLRANLKALVQSPYFSNVVSLAVVRDADDHPEGAFQSVCDALRAAGLSVPVQELILTAGNPKTAIMILPSPDSTGMLEDVCLKAVTGTPEMECVSLYFNCIKDKAVTLPGNMSKAQLQAYLAAREPELRLGEAAQKGLWAWDNPAFARITGFVKML